MSAFYDVGSLSEIAINLFYGWGYNFYRTENQLRADDQLIRAQASWLLGRARVSVETAESAYRREFLPPPSRAKPYPDPEAVAGAQTIERVSKEIGALSGRLSSLPVPENDRMTQRYRQEAETLARLADIDKKLIGQSELLRSLLDGKDGAWMIANGGDIKSGLSALGETLAQRQAALL